MRRCPVCGEAWRAATREHRPAGLPAAASWRAIGPFWRVLPVLQDELTAHKLNAKATGPLQLVLSRMPGLLRIAISMRPWPCDGAISQ